jgi:hypothetical protein
MSSGPLVALLFVAADQARTTRTFSACERPSNQVTDNRRRQQRTLVDRSLAELTCCDDVTMEGIMKLLLTSAGVKNTSIHDALVDLLGKPIAESSALCIPTAMYAMAVLAWRGG